MKEYLQEKLQFYNILTDGEAHIISLISKVILHKYRFKGRPKRVKFSPDGKHFAVCKGGGGKYLLF